jgi:hypothetical protein
VARHPEQSFRGLYLARCDAIRRLHGPGRRRAICVTDDGTDDQPAHAVLSFVDPEIAKSEAVAIRANLAALFSQGGPLSMAAAFAA